MDFEQSLPPNPEFAIPRHNGIELKGELYSTYRNQPMTCFDLDPDVVAVCSGQVCMLYGKIQGPLRLYPHGICSQVYVDEGRVYYTMKGDGLNILCMCDTREDRSKHIVFGNVLGMGRGKPYLKESDDTVTCYSEHTRSGRYQDDPDDILDFGFSEGLDGFTCSKTHFWTKHQVYDIDNGLDYRLYGVRGDIWFVSHAENGEIECLVNTEHELYTLDHAQYRYGDREFYNKIADGVVGYVVDVNSEEDYSFYPVIKELLDDGTTINSILSPVTEEVVVRDIGEINVSALSLAQQ